jgi:hypothetical protein
VPAAAPRAARLSEIFGIDSGLLERAFARVGDPASPDPDATLTAYLETDADPERAFGAIASVEGYRRLLDGVAAVSREEATPDGWLFRLAPPGLPGAGPAEIEDRVTPDAAAMTLRVARTSATSRSDSSFRVVTRDGKTWLLRKARLSGPREDLLRNDSLRGRLAAGLAVDLLAWTRRIDSSSTRS